MYGDNFDNFLCHIVLFGALFRNGADCYHFCATTFLGIHTHIVYKSYNCILCGTLLGERVLYDHVVCISIGHGHACAFSFILCDCDTVF